jgi:hypothetical protein
VTGFLDPTPGRLCAHCGAELARNRKTYCNNVCREATPRAFVGNPRGRPERMSVTPEFRTTLCGLWADGIPIREMGARLAISKNSVAGFVHRWKLVPRGTPIRRTGARKQPKPPQRPRKPEVPQTATKPADRPRAAPPAPKPPPSHPPAPAMSPKPEQLPPVQRVEPRPAAFPSVRTCQYVLNDDKPFVFCGKPTIGNGPYCTECRARCWVIPPRIRALEAA